MKITPSEALKQLRENFLFQPRSGKVEDATAFDLLDVLNQANEDAFQDKLELGSLKVQNAEFDLLKRIVEFLLADGSMKIEQPGDRRLLDYALEGCK